MGSSGGSQSEGGVGLTGCRVTRVVRGVAMVASLWLLVTTVPAQATPQLRVTICHATSSATNPYTLITVSISAIDGTGANDHSSHPGDIIPPVNSMAGQNWDARGRAVFAAGCSTKVLVDTDGDGKRDVIDPDDDGDGILDVTDPEDDGDGIADDQDPDQALKTDTDGDGTPDARDSDDDGDGIRDRFDPDDDGDGVPDVADPDRPGYLDADNDCIPDRDDFDDNNDGVFEAEPANAKATELKASIVVASSSCVGVDTDGDGKVDSADPDDNGDGKPDQFATDADGDRIPDYLDPDDDGDGIPDSRDSDDDGDGITETVAQAMVDLTPQSVTADDGVAVLLRDAAAFTDAGQGAAVTISCRLTTSLRSAARVGAVPMDADVPAPVKRSCKVKRSAGSWVAVVPPGSQAVATIRFRAPAVGDRLPVDVVQRVRIFG